MLPPFIIEQIRQREEKERMRQEDARRPRLELPLDRMPAPPRHDDDVQEDELNRGVVILDLV